MEISSNTNETPFKDRGNDNHPPPRRVTPHKPSPNGSSGNKSVQVIKAGHTQAKKESSSTRFLHSPRRQGQQRQFRRYAPLGLCLVVAGVYFVNHPTIPEMPLIGGYGHHSDGVVASEKALSSNKAVLRTTKTRSLAQTIHQRSTKLIDWKKIQSSYQGTVGQVQETAGSIVVQGKSVIQDVTGIAAVGTIVILRAVGDCSRRLLRKLPLVPKPRTMSTSATTTRENLLIPTGITMRLLEQVTDSTKYFVEGSKQMVGSMAEGIGSTTRQLVDGLTPLVVRPVISIDPRSPLKQQSSSVITKGKEAKEVIDKVTPSPKLWTLPVTRRWIPSENATSISMTSLSNVLGILTAKRNSTLSSTTTIVATSSAASNQERKITNNPVTDSSILRHFHRNPSEESTNVDSRPPILPHVPVSDDQKVRSSTVQSKTTTATSSAASTRGSRELQQHEDRPWERKARDILSFTTTVLRKRTSFEGWAEKIQGANIASLHFEQQQQLPQRKRQRRDA